MGVPPPWARKFYFPFVPFEISSQESCSDTSGGFQEGARGPWLPLIFRLNWGPKVSRSGSGTRCTVVVRRNPRALNDSSDKTDLNYYFFYFLNNYLFDKLSSKWKEGTPLLGTEEQSKLHNVEVLCYHGSNWKPKRIRHLLKLKPPKAEGKLRVDGRCLWAIKWST